MVISLLSITLLALILAFFVLPNIAKESPTIVTYTSLKMNADEVKMQKVSRNIPRKPSRPSSSMSRAIAASATAEVSIPLQEADVLEPSMSFEDALIQDCSERVGLLIAQL